MNIDEYAEIKGLEIFKIDTAETKDYTEVDLENMVAKANLHEAPVVIGHDENQDLLRNSGLLSAGWIKKIYRQGKSLFADLRDVPKVVADLIRKRAIAKRSVEIYNDFVDDAGNHHGKVIRRLAFLGGDIPRIKSLSDHLALYGEQAPADVTVINFSEINETIEGELKRREFDEKCDAIYWTFRDKLWQAFSNQESSDEQKKEAISALIDEFNSLLKESFKKTIGTFTETKIETEVKVEKEKEKIEKAAVQKFTEEFAKNYGKTPEELAAELETIRLNGIKQEVKTFCENLLKEGLAPKIVNAFSNLYLRAIGVEKFAEGESLAQGLNQFMTDLAAAVKDKSIYVEFSERGKVDDPQVMENVEKKLRGFSEGAIDLELTKKVIAYQVKHKCSFEEAYAKVTQK